MNNYVYATLLSTPSYIPGVLALYRSLQKYGHPNYPFVCVCSCGICDKDFEQLKSSGIDCLRLGSPAIPDSSVNNTDSLYVHWNYTFDKLLLWGLVQYDKIVFLDSDMIVLGNVDNLFKYADTSAVMAGHLIHSDWVDLNSGTIVIEPNLDKMNRMLDEIPNVVELRRQKGLSTGDQDVIAYCNPGWSSSKSLHIPEEYNIFFKHLEEYHDNWGYTLENGERIIKIVHFVGRQKPWEDGLLRRIKQRIKCFMYNRYGLGVYNKYVGLL